TKPRMEPNSYLFKAKSKTDILEIKWLLPPMEMWDQYEAGNVTEHELVMWSINEYKRHKYIMEYPDADDIRDETARYIYKKVYRELKEEEEKDKMILKPGLDFKLIH